MERNGECPALYACSVDYSLVPVFLMKGYSIFQVLSDINFSSPVFIDINKIGIITGAHHSSE